MAEEEPSNESLPPEAELRPHKIEAARSSRSRCRTCQRKIEKGVIRLGVLLEGPYGTGYLWHHLTCAARRHLDEVEAAYAEKAWVEGLVLPPLDELCALKEKAAEEKKNRKPVPYVDRAPTDRGRCKRCGEPFAKGAFRVALLREIALGRQTRATLVQVHPACVAEELAQGNCLTPREGFVEALGAHRGDLPGAEIAACVAEIGALG